MKPRRSYDKRANQMQTKKRTLAQTDEIVKSSAAMMEDTATKLDAMAKAAEAILGSTKLIHRLVGHAGDLRAQARQSLGKIR
jgi:hypothetical protein